MNTGLRDAEDNMIFVGDILKNKRNGNTYKVMFSYYSHLDSDAKAYGFWLCCDDLESYPIPECDGNRRLKLINTSRL